MQTTDDVILSDSLEEVPRRQREGFLTHALCSRGSCVVELGGRRFAFGEHDCMIVPQQKPDWQVVERDQDFSVTVIYASWEILHLATPASNYGTRGHLALYEDPVMHLTAEQYAACAANFDNVRLCLANKGHHFHRELLVNALQRMILDFFDFHVSHYGERKVSHQQSQVMQRFVAMLEGGDFLKSREVGWYAERLCVTPKHLSDVCRAVSGQTAIFWITRYTAHDIIHRLRTTALTLEQLSDLYGFASTNYFIRYVQNNLGLPPTALRE